MEVIRTKHGDAAVKYQKEWVKWTRGYWPPTGSLKAEDLKYVKSMGEDYINKMSSKESEV